MSAEAITRLAESFDFFNPFIAAKLVRQDGTEYPLWTNTANGSPLDIQVTAQGLEAWGDLRALSFLSEVTYENQLGNVPILTATLRPPFEDFIKLINTDLLEIGVNRLQVQFGYARSSSGTPVFQMYEGMIVEPPTFTIAAECTLTIKAQGLNGSLASQYQQGATTYSAMTRADILDQIAGKNGWVFTYDDDTKNDSVSGPALFQDKVTKSKAWQSDLFFITTLANECRCYLLWKGADDKKRQVIQVISRTAALAKQQPEFVISMFGYKATDIVGTTVYPATQIRASSGQIFLPGVQKFVLREIDADTKAVMTKPITAGENKTPQTNPGPSDLTPDTNSKVFPSAEDTEGARHAPGDPNEPSALAQAHHMFDTYSLAMAIPIDVETIGIPTIQPAALVRLRGIGPKLDLNYAVFNVTHIIGVNGFMTKLHMVSNTPEMLAKEFRSTQGLNQNPQQPQPEQDPSTDTKQAQKE